MNILNLIRSELRELSPYLPMETGNYARLHANELPWCPISGNSMRLNHYPNGQEETKLQAQLAEIYGVDTTQTLITRGSDDAIDILCRLFLDNGDAFLEFSPTFSMYAFFVRLQQAELIQCALQKSADFVLQREQITNAWKSNCKIIMFCSPNNPTGQIVDLELIAKTCAQYHAKSIVVVDEAYMEFSDSPSAMQLLSEFDNLIVLRTLSKGYGLAGLRLGTIIANAELIKACRTVTTPYALSTAVLSLATEALSDRKWFTKAHTVIKAQRDALLQALKPFPFIERIYPSHANFLLIQTPQAKELALFLANNGIIVRDFAENCALANCLRITVSDAVQNQLLIHSLSAFTPGLSS